MVQAGRYKIVTISAMMSSRSRMMTLCAGAVSGVAVVYEGPESVVGPPIHLGTAEALLAPVLGPRI